MLLAGMNVYLVNTYFNWRSNCHGSSLFLYISLSAYSPIVFVSDNLFFLTEFQLNLCLKCVLCKNLTT